MSQRIALPLFDHPRAGLKDRIKLSLGALVHPLQTRRWRNFVLENPAVAQLAHQYPRVLHKIYRPYLSMDLSCADRVDILIGHYRQLAAFGLSGLMCQAAREPVCLADFVGKQGTVFQLQLAATNVGHREGELTLQLIHEGVCVYTASFVLLRRHGECAIQLGALQGLRSDYGSQVIKTVTRELHGCRPRKLMVSLVRDLGDYFGCATIRLVSNRNRVTINWRRGKRISSDYDEIWEEMRAHRRPDGNYELACLDTSEKSLDAVPSHKRAEARRRHSLISEICHTLRGSLEKLRRPERRSMFGPKESTVDFSSKPRPASKSASALVLEA